MEEINVEDLVRYFKGNILLIATSVLTFILIMVIYLIFIKVPVYKSSTTIILTSDTSSYDTITSSDITLNKSLVSTYSEIIKSKKVLNQVIENLDLDTTYEDLILQISVSNITDTEMLKIEVSDENATNASIIANEISDVFAVDIVGIYSIENLSIIDYAEESEEPSNDDAVLQILLAGFIGLALSSSAVFLVYYFDRRVKTKEEIERITGLPVLGIVPLNKEVE